jgi:hypothetical protein
MGFLKPSPPEGVCGCLFSFIGGATGAWYGTIDFARYVAEERARNPNAAVCGLPIFAALFMFGMLGVFLGGFAGVFTGFAWRLISASNSRRRSDPPEAQR